MTTAAPLDIAPLPTNRDEWPPAAYGAGAPTESYASYTKLRSGEWGVRVPGGIQAGQLVVVRQRNGKERTECVRYVLWTGPDSRTGATISLATIGPTPVRAPVRSAPQPVAATTPRPAPQPAAKRTQPARSKRQVMPRYTAPAPVAARATVEADKARADAETALGVDEPLF